MLSGRGEEVSSDESENEGDGDDALSARRRTARRALSLARTQSSTSPAPSLPESDASQSSARQPGAFPSLPPPSHDIWPSIRRMPGLCHQLHALVSFLCTMSTVAHTPLWLAYSCTHKGKNV